MKTYYVKVTILNLKLTKPAERMIKVNRYGRQDDGKYFKNVKIVCKCKDDDSAINYIMDKFNVIAKDNEIKFKVEIFKTPTYNKKVAEKITKFIQ